jgi:D-3-phosphoglycerate dehydrogenase
MAGLKILFIDEVHPILCERLTEADFDCHKGYSLARQDILKSIKEYDGIVIRSKTRIDREFIDAASNLKFIARSGSGMENIDVPYATEKGIDLFNSPEGNRDAVAEQVIGMILSMLNNVVRSDREVRGGLWRREENRGIELGSKTVGLIGFGNTGQALAKRLGSFGCNVVANDPYLNQWPDTHVKRVDLEDLHALAEIISFHVPLTEDTNQMFNSAFVERMKHPFWLINTSRGKVVKTPDLVSGIRSGKILGACLDVLDYESTSFEHLDQTNDEESFKFLASSDQVILTPHIAGWTSESYVRLAEILADKILSRFG